MLWRTSCLTENREKRYFAKKKTKQNKKERDEKKKAKLICCGISTPGWTYGKFLSLSCKSDLTVLRRNQCSNMKSIPLTNKYPVELP